MRAVRARFFALLAAFVLLLPSGARAGTQYYCQMMGRVVSACCCDNVAAPAALRSAPEARVADCCQRMSSTTSSSAPATQAVSSVAPAALLAKLPDFFGGDPSSESQAAGVESAQVPLAIGPPLFVVHCALLS